jgi:hypothetical protein
VRLRKSVTVRGSEQRYEEGAEKGSDKHTSHACEEKVFHVLGLRSDYLLRSCGVRQCGA